MCGKYWSEHTALGGSSVSIGVPMPPKPVSTIKFCPYPTIQ